MYGSYFVNKIFKKGSFLQLRKTFTTPPPKKKWIQIFKDFEIAVKSAIFWWKKSF